MNNQKSASPSSLPLFCILLASLAGLSHPCSHMWPVASLSFMTWVLEGLLATCVVCMGCSWNQPAFTIDMLHQCLCLVPTALPSHSLPSAWCHAQVLDGFSVGRQHYEILQHFGMRYASTLEADKTLMECRRMPSPGSISPWPSKRPPKLCHGNPGPPSSFYGQQRLARVGMSFREWPQPSRRHCTP